MVDVRISGVSVDRGSTVIPPMGEEVKWFLKKGCGFISSVLIHVFYSKVRSPDTSTPTY